MPLYKSLPVTLFPGCCEVAWLFHTLPPWCMPHRIQRQKLNQINLSSFSQVFVSTAESLIHCPNISINHLGLGLKGYPNQDSLWAVYYFLNPLWEGERVWLNSKGASGAQWLSPQRLWVLCFALVLLSRHPQNWRAICHGGPFRSSGVLAVPQSWLLDFWSVCLSSWFCSPSRVNTAT